MLYYEDRRYTIIEKANGKYDVYDAKYGGKRSHKNQNKDWTDQFVATRQDFLNRVSHRKTQSVEKKQVSQTGNHSVRKSLPTITKWESLDAVATEDLAAKLLEKEDFSNYKYSWLAKVIQLSLEYLTLEGLQDARRASEIPDEILDICGEECHSMEQ